MRRLRGRKASTQNLIWIMPAEGAIQLYFAGAAGGPLPFCCRKEILAKEGLDFRRLPESLQKLNQVMLRVNEGS